MSVAQTTGRLTLPLRLLIDTNVFIALEPYAGRMEPGLVPAAELMRLVNEQGHRLFVHPATRDDLAQGRDRLRLSQQLAELRKFPMLTESPIPVSLADAAGDSPAGSNDHRDLRLLAALKSRAATYLISDDLRLRRRAARAGLGESVLTITEAVALLKGFAPRVSPPPPRVERVEPYALDGEQPIFESLRQDYAEFDLWLDRVRADSDNRDCLVVRTAEGRYAALAIVKRLEPDCAYPFKGPVTKIATLKVDQEYAGSKYGELLLKTIFADSHDRRAHTLYVEVLAKYEALVYLLNDFGFVDSGRRTVRQERVLVKRCAPPDDGPVLTPLEFHTRYGPPALSGAGRVFVVPIEPRWHEQLFPDAPPVGPPEPQLLLPGLDVEQSTHPWGNALRKAYLCNSNINQLRAGDTLLFYRSGDARSVAAVGVVEDTLRSGDPDEVVSYVGRRTVYTPTEIADLCRGVRGVLAILFRQDRFVDPPWELAELQQNQVLTTWPQSITRTRAGGAAWIHSQLGV